MCYTGAPEHRGEIDLLPQHQVLFLIQLVTDLDLLLPLWYEFQSKSDEVQTAVCVTAELLQRSAGTSSALTLRAIPFDVAGTEEIIAGDRPDLQNVAAVVTATETTLRPHKAAHALTQRANRVGTHTYTVQHGFENVGLTYFDALQTSAMVEFASENIFIWGPIAKLHPEVRPETRARCIPVGCCKALERRSGLPKPGSGERFVAVFENIHWLRYDDEYRARFLSDLTHTAESFPDTTFFVKPHPAGKWLTSRYKGNLPQAENLIIADPDDPQWASCTSSEAIGWADGVITTPSTTALDAARLGCPVAVIAYQEPLMQYRPLMQIQSSEHWGDFVRRLEHQTDLAALKRNASEFLDANLIPGNAAGRIIERILGDIRGGLPPKVVPMPEFSPSEKPQ